MTPKKQIPLGRLSRTQVVVSSVASVFLTISGLVGAGTLSRRDTEPEQYNTMKVGSEQLLFEQKRALDKLSRKLSHNEPFCCCF